MVGFGAVQRCERRDLSCTPNSISSLPVHHSMPESRRPGLVFDAGALILKGCTRARAKDGLLGGRPIAAVPQPHDAPSAPFARVHHRR